MTERKRVSDQAEHRQADEDQAEGTFTIVNVRGLHARAATKLVQLAARHRCEVELEKDGQRANAKSIMGVLLLCGGMGTRLTVRARGPDAREAVEAIGALIEARFGEDR
jgi:phosphocarrier protein